MNKSIQHWFKLITITGSAQVIVQGLGFVCGILIIRLLPIEEYALYILANTMLGTMTVLADGGISEGVMAEGGKVWKDKEKLGVVLATGLDLRRKFAVGSLIVTTPILLYLLLDNGASLLTSIMIALSLIPAFYASLSDTLLQIVPKLHQNIKPLQRNQVEVSIGRLIMIFSTLFVFPLSIVAIIANGTPRMYGNIKLKKIAQDHISANAQPDIEVRKNILKIVKRILPGAIYYAISGQLTIWLISIFGTTQSIAEIGALSRLALLVTFIIIIIDFLIVPRFAKLESNRLILLKEYFLLQIVLLIISLAIILVTYISSDYILFVFGDKYSGLNTELLLMAISSCATIFSLSTNKLLSSRGIIVPPALFITVMILVQFAFAFIVELSSVSGIIIYSILTTSTIYLMRVMYFLIQSRYK